MILWNPRSIRAYPVNPTNRSGRSMNFTDLTSFKKLIMNYPMMWRGGWGILLTHYKSAYFIEFVCVLRFTSPILPIKSMLPLAFQFVSLFNPSIRFWRHNNVTIITWYSSLQQNWRKRKRLLVSKDIFSPHQLLWKTQNTLTILQTTNNDMMLIIPFQDQWLPNPTA